MDVHQTSALRRFVCPVVVGRDDLLDLADRRIGEVRAGQGQLLLIAGEAGIGKSRLASSIERRAAEAGLATLRCGTYPGDLQVRAAIIVDLARTLGRTDPHRDLGRRLLARLDDVDSEAGADASRRRRLLVFDLVDLLVELVAAGPVVLTLEDLHWADDLTLEVLEALARRIPSLPLFVIATYRTDELSPRIPMREWRVRLLTQRLAEEVRARRLTVAETGSMIALIGGLDTPPANDVVAAVHGRTDGIPLHVEEFLANLRPPDLETAEAIDAASAPSTVQDAILERLAHRSPRARRVADAGAVIGRAFDVDLLAVVLDEAPERLADDLTELAEHHILLPTGTPGRLGFRHAIIGDAIYDHLPEPRRRELHRRTAQAAAARPELGTHAFLATQFERAGQPAEAHAAALKGAAAASAISSHREARDLYTRAVRTAPADLDPLARGRLLEALGSSCAATDHNDEAATAFEGARLAYLEGGARLDAAAVAVSLVAARHLLGADLAERTASLDAALTAIDDARPAIDVPDAARDPHETQVRARLLAAMAAAYMLDRRLDDATAYALDAQHMAEAAGDRLTWRNATTTLGVCHVFAGRTDEGWQSLERMVVESLEDGSEAEAARAYRMLGSCASVLLEYPRAERWLEEGIAFAERVEQWNHRNYMAAHLAHVRWATGRWDEADAIAAASLADGRGGATTRVTASYVVGYVALGRGETARSKVALEEALALGTRMAELQRRSPPLWGLAELARQQADPVAAIQIAESGLAASDQVGDAAYLFPFVVTGTRAYLEADDPLRAERWIARVRPSIESRAIPGTELALVHATALVASARGESGSARAGLETAISGWDRLGRVWEGAWARIDLARSLLRSNRRRDADRLAADARAIGVGIGSPPIVAGADAILLRGSRTGTEPDAWAPLTAREFEVARLAADGWTNGAIGDELGVSPRTVSAHIEHILAKLDIERRVEIAGWMSRRGLVLHSRPHGRDREE